MAIGHASAFFRREKNSGRRKLCGRLPDCRQSPQPCVWLISEESFSYASFFLPVAAMNQKTTRISAESTYQMIGAPPKKSII